MLGALPRRGDVGKSTNFIPALAGEGIVFNLFGLTVHLADPNASGVGATARKQPLCHRVGEY